jgi:hypothetical protein
MVIHVDGETKGRRWGRTDKVYPGPPTECAGRTLSWLIS